MRDRRRNWNESNKAVGVVEEGGPPIRYLDISFPLTPALRPKPEDPIPSDLDPIPSDLDPIIRDL